MINQQADPLPDEFTDIKSDLFTIISKITNLTRSKNQYP